MSWRANSLHKITSFRWPCCLWWNGKTVSNKINYFSHTKNPRHYRCQLCHSLLFTQPPHPSADLQFYEADSIWSPLISKLYTAHPSPSCSHTSPSWLIVHSPSAELLFCKHAPFLVLFLHFLNWQHMGSSFTQICPPTPWFTTTGWLVMV